MFRSCIASHTARYALARSTCPSRSTFIRSFSAPPRPPEKSPTKPEGPTPEMWARIEPTIYHFFHNPDDDTSKLVLSLFQKAIVNYPTEIKHALGKRQWRGKLKAELIVHERCPTAEEFRLLLPYLPLPSFTSLLTEKGIRTNPTNSIALVDLVSRDPEALLWPIVVDWEHGECAIGRTKQNVLLKNAFKRRKAGMRTKEEEREEKRVAAAASAAAAERSPPPVEWIDYD
ncbi:hypothetical protein DFH06DRAFT_1131486 [Mycena polygramma]|nr:hypothetical protein DFH06DRAFT_1131486 [Mycena polygramma]